MLTFPKAKGEKTYKLRQDTISTLQLITLDTNPFIILKRLKPHQNHHTKNVEESRKEARNLLRFRITFSRNKEIRHELRLQNRSIWNREASEKILSRQHFPTWFLKFMDDQRAVPGTDR